MAGILAHDAKHGIVIVGGGVAGLRSAQSARRWGFGGPITLIGDEQVLPYDRPALSKQMLLGELGKTPPPYITETQLKKLDVTALVGCPAISVNAEERVVTHGGGTTPYDALVVATGARPVRLKALAGANNVHYLRSATDAVGLKDALEVATNIAVVGAGLIGSEVASSARSLGLHVTMIEAGEVPLSRSVGGEMGHLLSGLSVDHGVDLRCGHAVVGYVGTDRLAGLVLDDGSVVECDLAVVGVGVRPNTDWLAGSGVETADGVVCDEFQRTNVERIVAVGDVSNWPNPFLGQRVRPEQWTIATDQGRYVAQMLLHGAEEVGPFRHDMYFWSDQYGVRIQGCGPLSDATPHRLTTQDDPSRWTAAFCCDGRVTGALAVNSPREFAALRALVNAAQPSDLATAQQAVAAITKERIPS